MTTNRILTTLVQLILAGVTIPLLILAIKDFKHDLKNRQFNFQLNPTRPTAAGLICPIYGIMSVLPEFPDFFVKFITRHAVSKYEITYEQVEKCQWVLVNLQI